MIRAFTLINPVNWIRVMSQSTRLMSERLEPRTLLSATLLKDISPGTEPSIPIVEFGVGPNATQDVDARFKDLNGELLFIADDGTHGLELFRTDGTAAGTSLVKDINPGPASSATARAQILGDRWAAVVGDTLYFAADDGTHGAELWKSDGTADGTVMVKDIAPGSDSGLLFAVSLVSLTKVGDSLFFTATTDQKQLGLWKSDGTDTGTVLVKAFPPDSTVSTPQALTDLNGTLYFSEANSASPQATRLWKSDGTANGTVLVKNIDPGPGTQTLFGRHLTALANLLYFAADDGTHGIELWKSDGTKNGTIMVKDIRVGISNGLDSQTVLVPSGNLLYFSALDKTHGTELWVSDGTTNGTHLVADIRLGSSGSAPTSLAGADGEVFFSADDGVHGFELWRSDGTADGTSLVADIAPGEASSAPYNIVDIDSEIYFLTGGNTLYQSDGTANNTIALNEFERALDLDIGVSGLTNIAGKLFFAGYDAVHGFEPWIGPFAELHGQTLHITATNAGDTLSLRIRGDNLEVRLNGQLAKFPVADVPRIEIQALGGNDVVDWTGIGIATYINAGTGNDLVTAGAGNDSLTGGAGKDTLLGGEGDDRIDGNGTSDKLFGQSGNDTIYGGAGNDVLDGGGNVDRLFGGDGNDSLFGGNGNDKLHGESGADTIAGGRGFDSADNDPLDVLIDAESVV